MTNKIKRIYVRRYSDNGQTVAYVDWANGKRTEGHPKFWPFFGSHMHALFARGKREGLRLRRETW